MEEARFEIKLNEYERITLHNAVVKLYNRKKPKSYRDSEWAMERGELKQLLLKLKRPDEGGKGA